MKFKDGIEERHVIVKCGVDRILPFALLFGIYIILFGTISPGGGFQGGVMVASVAIFLYLAYGYKTATEAVKFRYLSVVEALGSIIYVILGFVGIFAGAVFAKNVFFDDGEVGNLISAGNITFMGYAVGIKVLTGMGYLILVLLGLLAPGVGSKEEEGTEEEDEE